MERIIGIDYGLKRVGVAVSDPLGIFASPLETVPTAKIIDYLESYMSENKVSLFVVGYPVNLNNRPSECAPHVAGFIRRLAKKFPSAGIIKEDERFTSQIAMRAMIDGGMKKSDRRVKGAVDKISAALILQTYLDGKSRGSR
ncbi:MAG: Holliday junction resolvase RuvX [Bacteroidales bacterium]|jgi:putative Holliday junction resolvase|nr:Holliday junction resolvase RuvX [Bacteroidales bacterium]